MALGNWKLQISLQEKGGWDGGEGRRALQTERLRQREMDRDMKRERQKEIEGRERPGDEVRV